MRSRKASAALYAFSLAAALGGQAIVDDTIPIITTDHGHISPFASSKYSGMDVSGASPYLVAARPFGFTMAFDDIHSNEISVFNAKNGTAAWTRFLDSSPLSIKARAGSLFACTESSLYCLDLGSGACRWRYDISQRAFSDDPHFAREAVERRHPSGLALSKGSSLPSFDFSASGAECVVMPNPGELRILALDGKTQKHISTGVPDVERLRLQNTVICLRDGYIIKAGHDLYRIEAGESPTGASPRMVFRLRSAYLPFRPRLFDADGDGADEILIACDTMVFLIKDDGRLLAKFSYEDSLSDCLIHDGGIYFIQDRGAVMKYDFSLRRQWVFKNPVKLSGSPILAMLDARALFTAGIVLLPGYGGATRFFCQSGTKGVILTEDGAMVRQIELADAVRRDGLENIMFFLASSSTNPFSWMAACIAS